MADARQLPRSLSSKRLSIEVAAIIGIADALIHRLRKRDLLGNRVELSKIEYCWFCFLGAVKSLCSIRKNNF